MASHRPATPQFAPMRLRSNRFFNPSAKTRLRAKRFSYPSAHMRLRAKRFIYPSAYTRLRAKRLFYLRRTHVPQRTRCHRMTPRPACAKPLPFPRVRPSLAQLEPIQVVLARLGKHEDIHGIDPFRQKWPV